MNLVIYIIICLCIGIWICVQRDKFMLNSDSLHKQWLFRLAIAFPLVSSVYFIAWLGAPYPFRWDAYGYSTFLEINKFSLGILALSPILGAFVVSAHRSIQTTKQIEVTERKNKVDIYFSERKFIIEQLGKIKSTNYGECINENNTYEKFINFNDYDSELIKESFDLIDSRVKEIYESYNYACKYIDENPDNNSTLEHLISKSNLSNIEVLIESVILYCEIKIDRNKFRINKIINDFFEKNDININNYEINLNNLLLEVSFEIAKLYYFLHGLFAIILLNKDIPKVLPHLPCLENIKPIRSHNGT